jgi:protein SCO1/2
VSELRQRVVKQLLRFAVPISLLLLLIVSFSSGNEAIESPVKEAQTGNSAYTPSDHFMDGSRLDPFGSRDSDSTYADKDGRTKEVPNNSIANAGRYGAEVMQDGAIDHSRSTLLSENEPDSRVLNFDGSSAPVMATAVPFGSTEAGVTEHLGATISTPLFFTDSTGQRVNLRSLITTPVLIVPVYYSCTDACDVLMSAIAVVLPNVTLVPNKDYRVLMVSFDENDTPELAAQKKQNLLQALHVTDPAFPADAWKFLVGDKSTIQTLMREIGFRFKRVDNEFVYPIALVAVTPDGKITRYLYGTDILPFDATMALTEGDTNMPLFSMQRLIRMCFSYDPVSKKYVLDPVKISGVAFAALVLLFLCVMLLKGKNKKRKKLRL